MPQEVKISEENFKAKRKSLNLHNLNMTQKPESTSGRFKVTSFIAITKNLEFNSMCRKKKHALFH